MERFGVRQVVLFNYIRKRLCEDCAHDLNYRVPSLL